MTSRPHALLDTLLQLHRERVPQALLHSMLCRLAPGYGRAVACCYLLDENGQEVRLAALQDTADELTQQSWRADLRAPMTMPFQHAAAVLADIDGPVQMIAPLPGMLSQLLPVHTVAALHLMIAMERAVVAPVQIDGATVGLLLIAAAGGWPEDVLANLAGHAAAALANLHERGSLVQATADMFMRGVIEQVASREMNRAERYGRALSMAVVEVPEADASAERLLGLATLVARVMRQPDTAGHLDDRHIVVLLPETPAVGASAFLRRLREQAGPDLASIRAACVTFPQDGRTWTGVMQSAFARLAHADTPPLHTADGEALSFVSRLSNQFIPLPIAENVPLDLDRRDADEDHRIAVFPGVAAAEPLTRSSAATLRVQVTPIARDDVPQWQALLMRLPSVATIQAAGFDGQLATFDLGVPSVASVLGQLRNLAIKMDAGFNIAITGEVGLTLLRQPSRAAQAAPGRTEAAWPSLAGVLRFQRDPTTT